MAPHLDRPHNFLNMHIKLEECPKKETILFILAISVAVSLGTLVWAQGSIRSPGHQGREDLQISGSHSSAVLLTAIVICKEE
jgi:hypothetical protein